MLPIIRRHQWVRSSWLRATVFCLLAAGVEKGAVAQKAIGGLAIIGAKVFSAPGKRAIDYGIVLVRNGRITRVGPAKSISVPRNYRVLKYANASVTAGFWNSHVHLTRPSFLNIKSTTDAQLQSELDADFTRWGFTTVFDLASTTETANELKDRLQSGRVTGPRVLSVGEPFYPPNATPIYARPLYTSYNLPLAEIISPGQATVRVARQIQAGADGIKLFAGSIVGGPEGVVHMDAASVRAIAAAAHGSGKRVFAHPTDRAGLEVASLNGVDVLAHSAPLMGSWASDFARSMATRGVALIPTLSLFAAASDASTPVSTAIQQTRALADAGGTIIFGTDAGFTDVFDTASEMTLMNEALGWSGLLRSLTTAPAKVFGEEPKRGRVQRGLVADLVVLDGDPSRDIRAFSSVLLVIRGGQIVFQLP